MRRFSILCVLMAAYTGCAKKQIAEVGDRAPSFELRNVSTDQPLKLDANSGKLIVLNFWSTSCSTCLMELPDLNQLNADEAAVVIGIALDEDAARVKRVVSDKELSFEVALGSQELFETYDGYAIPYTLILDKNQKIRKRFRGPVSHEDLVKVLNQIEQLDSSIAAN